MEIRLATLEDAARILDVYAPYVANTAISFEHEVPSLDDYRHRLETVLMTFPWLVAADGVTILGYAYACPHRARAGYAWSPESSIYLSPAAHGSGVAPALYGALFAILKAQGFVNVFAGIGLPNDRSVAFHKRCGFQEIGVFKQIGFKHERWHDTGWYQLALQEAKIPSEIIPIGTFANTSEFLDILNEANERLRQPIAAER